MTTLPARNHAAAGPALNDILYVLFRQKWKILICTALGLGVALGLYHFQPAPFQSEALLYIRYVMENSAPGVPGNDTKAVSPDQRGETIIASEAEILGSMDLAYDVVDVLGPEKFLSETKGVKSRDRAALVVRQNLLVDPLPKSSVIRLVFQSRDETLVQPVLTALVAAYLKKHIEVHRGIELAGDFLSQETDQLHSRLAQTEEQLQKAKEKAGIISLVDTQKAYTEQVARIRQDIFSTEAELADRSATLAAMAGTGAAAAATGPASAGPAPVPDAQLDEYGSIRARLEWLQQMKSQLLGQFTEQSQRVRDVQAQIEQAESRKRQLEQLYPALARVALPSAAPGPARGGDLDPRAQAALLVGLQAKVKVLKSELTQIEGEENSIDQLAGTITELQRQKELEEANYRYYAEHLEAARIDETLGSGRTYNIAQIQAPTPPHTDPIKEAELLGGIAGGGLILGLAWAFLIEFYFDRSIRRPAEIERDLQIPLFLSMPKFTGKSERHVYHETLRDRLIGYMESKGLIHKPKLVAVTGIGRGAGVTSTAAGLAQCLSETGDGNVLLVDMTAGQGSAQQFYKGKAVCGLDQILETRGDAQIQDKLFVVGEQPNQDRLSRALPARFNTLVPKLKASDFDYIIFDLPAVNQISITPRLASFMDIVLLVIESEQSDRDLVRQAVALLAESRARVGAVLNRTRTYLPYSSHREFLGTR